MVKLIGGQQSRLFEVAFGLLVGFLAGPTAANWQASYQKRFNAFALVLKERARRASMDGGTTGAPLAMAT
jgi:hypothetical protein